MSKYLFVVQVLTNGGAERVVANLSSQLADMGHEVTIIVYNRVENEYLVNPKVRIIALNAAIPIVRKMQRPYLIGKYAKQLKPDYIIPFLPLQVVETFLGYKRRNSLFVSTVRNNPDFDKDLIGKMYFYTLRHSDSVFCQTDAQMRLLPSSVKSKSFVLPNPITPSILDSFNSRVYTDTITKFVTVGRLEKQKNHKMMLEAFRIAHQKYPQIKLRIYGEGQFCSEIKQLIKSIKANEYVELMGRTEHVDEVLLENHVFLFSSNYEGMPNALMEAMASGLPCVSTDCPTGPKELIGNNERGILTPIENVEEFAKRIIYVLEHTNEMKLLGQAAHDYLGRHYSLASIAEQLDEKLCILNKAKEGRAQHDVKKLV